ncbi:MAG: hypothetical protein VB011_09875 [Bacteroidales bacterium]|nr:hypothetical protein [Bacteroidales bacterium]
MDFFEQKKRNEEEIRKFIIDFLYNDLYLNGEKSIDGCPRNLMKFLSEKRDRAIKYQTTDEYSTYLYNKFEKIEESTNPLFLNWKKKGYPLLTSKCEEPNLKFVFDFSFSIIRNQYEESYSEYYESFKPVLYGNNKIVDYLNSAKNLIQKDSQVFEIEVIDFLNYYYMVNANCDIYQEFINTIETTKRCISDFIFLYIEYYVYKRFWFEYLLNKENEPTYNNESNKTREKLKTKFSETELIRIFNELVKNKYISCDLDLFLSCFGYRDEIEDKIIWKSTYVQFEIFISEIVQKEENSLNDTLCFPRKKINLWFLNKKSKEINVAKKINNRFDTYPIYKIIHP